MSYESRYFLCSIPPNRLLPAVFQEYVLEHWQVESLHWYKDCYFDEDKHRFGASMGSVWTVLTNMAYSLGQVLRPKDKEPFCAVFEQFHIHPDKALKRLGFRK